MSREIELKLLVEADSFSSIRDIISHLIPSSTLEHYSSSVYADAYWPAKSADSVRIRVSKDVDITTKTTDKGTVRDRNEERVLLPAAAAEAMSRVLTQVTGEEPYTIVWQCSEWHVGTNLEISLVKNVDDKIKLFVEVEGDHIDNVMAYARRIKDRLAEDGVKAMEVRNSFYSIYVLGQGPIV